MDEIKELVQTYTAGLIDFKGQEKAEKYINKVSYYGGAACCVASYILRRFDIMVYGFAVVASLVVILSLPLPIYKKNPVKWLQYTPPTSQDIVVDFGTDEKKDSTTETTQKKQTPKKKSAKSKSS